MRKAVGFLAEFVATTVVAVIIMFGLVGLVLILSPLVPKAIP